MRCKFSVESPRVAFVGVLIGVGGSQTVQRIFRQGHNFFAIVNPTADQATNQHPRRGRNGRWTAMRCEVNMAVQPVQAMNSAAKGGEETTVEVAAPMRRDDDVRRTFPRQPMGEVVHFGVRDVPAFLHA